MNLLVVNTGSTSVKFKLFNENFDQLLSGIAYSKLDKYFLKIKNSESTKEEEITNNDFSNLPEIIIKNIEFSIDVIGFRVVHGGEFYDQGVIITNEVIENLEKLSVLAPLHNPPALKVIKKFRQLMKDKDMYAVFDTSFHQTMKPFVYMYGLPYEFYEKYKIRKYGFHGISCQYTLERMMQLDKNASKIIICHLGGGSSITAVEEYKSVDTSMGFTPLEGVMMATRSGDVDDGAILYMIEEMKLSVDQIKEIENKKSGLLGISGLSDDMRKLLKYENTNPRAKLAIDMYVYKIQKEIGAMTAALGGIDALIFTAGIGAGSDVIREKICQKLNYLNLTLDGEKNKGEDIENEIKISTQESKSIWIIPTNEELQIAKSFLVLAGNI